MMIFWAVGPAAIACCFIGCTKVFFDGLELGVDLGKRRHRRREVRWVPVDKDPQHLDTHGLPKTNAPLEATKADDKKGPAATKN